MTFLALFIPAVLLVGVAGYLRATLGPKPPRAGSTPVDPAGGFASPQQVLDHLSAGTVRHAGAQVRPGLPVQAAATTRRKGLLRGRR